MSDIVEDMERKGSLITGLPDDLALLCLARLPRVHHSSLGRVCKSWWELFRSPEFFKLRAELMINDPWLMVVGESRQSKSFAYFMYDLRSKKRCNLPPVALPDQVHMGGFKCAAIEAQFFVLGGQGAGLYGRPTVHVFDTITRQWSMGVEMNVPRCFFSCGLINGKLFVAGGYNGNGQLDQTGEVYDPKTKEWSMIAPMPFGLATIESEEVFKGRLFVKGRFQRDKEDRKVLCYDPVTDTWEHEKKMENRLSEGEFAATEEGLFLFNRFKYVGRYDEKTSRWDEVGIISCYYFPYECPAKKCICFGKEVFFLNNLAGECLNLQSFYVVHQVLTKVFWKWHGAIVAV